MAEVNATFMSEERDCLKRRASLGAEIAVGDDRSRRGDGRNVVD